MRWRAGELILARRDESFALIEPGGTVARWFHGRTFSDEDDLWVTRHLVVGDALVERTTIEHGGDPARVYEEHVVVADLRVVADAQVDRVVAAALAAADVAAAAHERARARVADARVTAIAGAEDELGLGPDLARAQRALCHRIRTWNDERAARLLRTLLALARARPGPAVITAYARGCLLACFEFGAPELIAAAPTAGHAALAATIAAHADELDQAADVQEQADAGRNAAALWSAARALRAAVALMAG
ncbi:MAG: hypothetical protein IPL61_06620 [Myxococcales bacterium]|nr:hypothetical protein [Myxococcales bacterium]